MTNTQKAATLVLSTRRLDGMPGIGWPVPRLHHAIRLRWPEVSLVEVLREASRMPVRTNGRALP